VVGGERLQQRLEKFERPGLGDGQRQVQGVVVLGAGRVRVAVRQVQHVARFHHELVRVVVGVHVDQPGAGVDPALGGVEPPLLGAGQLDGEDVGAVAVRAHPGVLARGEEDVRLEFGRDGRLELADQVAGQAVPVLQLVEFQRAALCERLADAGRGGQPGDLGAAGPVGVGDLVEVGPHALLEDGEVGAAQQRPVDDVLDVVRTDEGGHRNRLLHQHMTCVPVVVAEHSGIDDQCGQRVRISHLRFLLCPSCGDRDSPRGRRKGESRSRASHYRITPR
jgi:hypothetical protein